MRAAAGVLVAAGLFLAGVLTGVGSRGTASVPPVPIVLEGTRAEPGSSRPLGRNAPAPDTGGSQLDVQEVQREVEYGEVADYESEGGGGSSGPDGGHGEERERDDGDSSGPGSSDSSDSSDSGSSDSSDSSGSGSSGSEAGE